VGNAMRGARGKTHQIIGWGVPKNVRKKSKITIAPLYINYEPSLSKLISTCKDFEKMVLSSTKRPF